MESQPTVPPTSTPPVVPVAPTPAKSKLPMILVSLVVLLLVGGGGIFLGTQFSKTSVPTPTPASVTVVPTIAVDPIANWKTMTFDLSTSFKIPQEVVDPRYVNTGHYAQFTTLPGNTTFQIWGGGGASPTGGKDDYDLLKHLLSSSEKYVLKEMQTADHESLDFKISGPTTLIQGGEVSLKTHGVLLKMNDGHGLVVLHYQSTTQKDGNFDSDEIIFDQILSTFKFTSGNQSQNILDIIKTQTSPMVWTAPQKGTGRYFSKDFPGSYIESTVTNKDRDKLASLIGQMAADGSSGLQQYGWKYDIDLGGEGVQGSSSYFETPTKNPFYFLNVSSINGANGFTYKIFLSDPIY